MTAHFIWLLDGSIVSYYLLATMVAGLMMWKCGSRVGRFLVGDREGNIYLGIASPRRTKTN